MRGIAKCITITALCLTAIGCGPSIYRGVIPPEALAEVDLQYYWEIDLGPDDGGEKITSIWLLDEKLYCLTDRNRLVAVDAATGVRKWSYEITRKPTDTVFLPPAHFDDIHVSRKTHGIPEMMGWKEPPLEPPFDAVMLNTVYHMVMLDRVTGAEWRHVPLKFPANCGGCSDGRYYFTGATGGRYHAIALNEAIEAWSLSTDSMITSPPAYHNGRLFVASEDHHLYSAEVGTRGKQVWRQTLDASVVGQLHVDSRGCFVPCLDNRLYAFDAMSGTTLWDPFVCAGPLSQGVQAGEDTLFQYADRDGLYAINVANGRKRWHMPSAKPSLVAGIIGGMAYVRDTDADELRIVDELLGTITHTIDVDRDVLFARNALMPAVYIATPDGRVFCIRLKSAGRLTEEMLRG